MSRHDASRSRSGRKVTPSALAWAASAFLLCGCSLLDPQNVRMAPPNDVIVYAIERGWHTDIGLPVKEIVGPLTTLKRVFPGVQFLTFGFGERQFLMDRQMRLGAMLSALLPSRSALLTTALGAAPKLAFGQTHVVVLCVSRAGLERIEARLWQEFERTAADEPVSLADGPYPGSVFYAAHDTYDGFYTCNTWTAELLHAGGLPIPTAGILFAGQVMGMARWIGTQQASLCRG